MMFEHFLKTIAVLLITGILFCGCSTNSNMENRKQEKWLQYSAFSYEVRNLIEQQTICQGMVSDAVYIAFGAPDEEFNDQELQGTFRWVYGEAISAKKPKVFFKEYKKGDRVFLQKCDKKEKNQNIYSRAEIIFSRDRVLQWQLLDKQR